MHGTSRFPSLLQYILFQECWSNSSFFTLTKTYMVSHAVLKRKIDRSTGNIFKCPTPRKAFKPFYPVGTLLYIININECRSSFCLCWTKIENQTLSFSIYCVDITHSLSLLIFVKFVKMMNFFVKCGKK